MPQKAAWVAEASKAEREGRTFLKGGGAEKTRLTASPRSAPVQGGRCSAPRAWVLIPQRMYLGRLGEWDLAEGRVAPRSSEGPAATPPSRPGISAAGASPLPAVGCPHPAPLDMRAPHWTGQQVASSPGMRAPGHSLILEGRTRHRPGHPRHLGWPSKRVLGCTQGAS